MKRVSTSCICALLYVYFKKCCAGLEFADYLAFSKAALSFLRATHLDYFKLNTIQYVYRDHNPNVEA